MNRDTDIVVGGGGFVGLAFALALTQECAGVRITVCDPGFGRAGAADARAFTVAAGSKRLLERLGVWAALEADAQPVEGMDISDGRLADVLRPIYLSFAGEAAFGEPFAHVVDSEALRRALQEAAEAVGIELRAVGVESFAADGGAVSCTLSDGAKLRASLLVASDGARSKLRGQSGIGVHGWSYGRGAIVTTISHGFSHNNYAVQHFLEGGPFALLPMTRNRSSVVWVEPWAEAKHLVALPDAEFRDELARRVGTAYGEAALAGGRALHPLSLRIARRFVGSRFALMGDAAHGVHPLAGQGANLGLRDAAALAEVLADALRLGGDLGGEDVLTRYERWRRFDVLMMVAATEGLARLFALDAGPVRMLRDVGMGLVDRMPLLKNAFIRNAAGLSGNVPKLMS